MSTIMQEIIEQSVFGGVTLTLVTYLAGDALRRKFKLAILNPLLFSTVAIIAVLVGLHIDYDTYNEGAKYISYLLTPATVCLAVPLYEQAKLLRSHMAAILAGILSGVLTSGICVLALSMLFHLSHKEFVTLIPKSITTPIGIGVSEELGGIATITAVVIVITGVFGGVMAEFILKIFHITDPIAKGIGIGSSAHVVGTAKAMEIGQIEGAMSSLSIAVSGLLTVILAPLFAGML